MNEQKIAIQNFQTNSHPAIDTAHGMLPNYTVPTKQFY